MPGLRPDGAPAGSSWAPPAPPRGAGHAPAGLTGAPADLTTGFVCLPDTPPGPAGGQEGVKWHVAPGRGGVSFPRTGGAWDGLPLAVRPGAACKLLRSPGAR